MPELSRIRRALATFARTLVLAHRVERHRASGSLPTSVVVPTTVISGIAWVPIGPSSVPFSNRVRHPVRIASPTPDGGVNLVVLQDVAVVDFTGQLHPYLWERDFAGHDVQVLAYASSRRAARVRSCRHLARRKQSGRAANERFVSIRTDARSRIITTTGALLLTVSLAAGCTSPTHSATGSTPSASRATGSTPAASSTASVAASASASPSAATSATPSPSAAASSAAAENRVVTADIRAQLLAGFLPKHGFAADQIAGTSPGSVYYAYVPSTNTYWAAATFVASSMATEQTGVNMQDGGAEATFTRFGTGAWDVHIHDSLWPCAGDLPASVLAVWHLTIVEGCEVTSPSATS